jgi:Zn-dependent peptidase ImmA (M78 family)
LEVSIVDPAVAARKLLDELGAPCDEDTLALALRKFGIELIEDRARELDAMFVYIPKGKPVIAVNSSRPLRRKRFSIAHELGHFVLGHNSISFFEGASGMAVCIRHDARLEREANIFAAELLMPKVALAREAHKFTIEELTRRYMVSVQAMEIRLKELGLVCKGG